MLFVGNRIVIFGPFQIAKNRYSGDLGIIPLDFDKAGLSHMQRRKNVCSDKMDEVKVLE